MDAAASLIFSNDAASEFIDRLRSARPTVVGDMISDALRAVAQAEQPLSVDDVRRALVALALLLSEFDPQVLAGAPEPDGLRVWFTDLEIELNPARRQVAAGALGRILLPQDNRWQEQWDDDDLRAAALTTVRQLRDTLVDAQTRE